MNGPQQGQRPQRVGTRYRFVVVVRWARFAADEGAHAVRTGRPRDPSNAQWRRGLEKSIVDLVAPPLARSAVAPT